jgi:flavin reductase (DIM6/NTAB) family NADH-FMN oxidoreductase RutF
MGILWNRPVATVFVRPGRHTFGLIERHDHFSLSFFGPEYRKALDFCGSNSGRSVDKAARTGLTPVFEDDDRVFFAEARLVLVCRKIYSQDLDASRVLSPGVTSTFYSKGDWHRAFTGEIVRCLRRD